MLCCDMAKKTKSSQRSALPNFAKISAVEGIRHSHDHNEDFGEVDRKMLPSKARGATLATKSGTKRLGLAKGKFKMPHDIDVDNMTVAKMFRGKGQ